MTLEQLAYFVAAAEQMNFSKAADLMYVHPTSIGRGIASIESELGCNLFIRHRKSLELTETGKYFLRRGCELLDTYDDIMKKTRNMRLGTAGHIIIKGQPNYLNILSPCYRTFKNMYPDAELTVDTIINEEIGSLVPQIISGTVDLGVLFFPSLPRDSSSLQMIRIFTETMDLIVSREHRLANHTSVCVESLQGETGLVGQYMEHNAFDFINAELVRRSLPPVILPPQEKLPATESELYMHVSAGYGIAYMPRTAALKSNWDCVILPIDGVDTTRDLFLVWCRENQNPTLRLFLDVVRGVLGIFENQKKIPL